MRQSQAPTDPGKLLQPSKGGANRGFFHEIGHNMQNVKDRVFNGSHQRNDGQLFC